jgi:hypothetical protein
MPQARNVASGYSRILHAAIIAGPPGPAHTGHHAPCVEQVWPRRLRKIT